MEYSEQKINPLRLVIWALFLFVSWQLATGKTLVNPRVDWFLFALTLFLTLVSPGHKTWWYGGSETGWETALGKESWLAGAFLVANVGYLVYGFFTYTQVDTSFHLKMAAASLPLLIPPARSKY